MIPIRTEMILRRTPLANYAMIGINVLAFAMFNFSGSESLQEIKHRYLVLNSGWPALYQFFTYQFLHDGIAHLAGNMLFLWVFGNCVNAKMGDVAYVLFYLAGGVFAGFVFAAGSPDRLLGASGAIASVTTAYLALFPRSRVTVMYIFFFIGFFELPAILLIGLKIVLWDNIISPQISGPGNVAFSAHLGGYAFGLVAAVSMLLLRVIPRDHFDLLSLLDRWNRRRVFQAAMADPERRRKAEFGAVARTPAASAEAEAAEDANLDRITDLRGQIGECLSKGEDATATKLYEQLIAVDPTQCLSARHQLVIAREFYAANRFPQAVGAFERYLGSYAVGRESEDIRLLVGIIYARDLQQYATAEKHLQHTLDKLHDGPRREQCIEWLETVRRAIGKPAADA